MDQSDADFLANLHFVAKFKQRSHDTHHDVHMPELNTRLNKEISSSSTIPGPKLQVIYLGNSMLERLKTTGINTRLGKLGGDEDGLAFNAGCGGDKNENIIYRLGQGLYDILRRDPEEEGKEESEVFDIKLWILASGTNNLHIKRGLRNADVKSWKALVEACLRIAPRSWVLCCDVFYRLDVGDELVDQGNQALEKVVADVNAEQRGRMGDGEDRVIWVEARKLIKKESMLVDHVHLNEEGYEVWDGVLWPYVVRSLGTDENEGG